MAATIPAPASNTSSPTHKLASDPVAPLEAASPAAASVEIEDIEEEELLDWGDVEEAEDIEAAPLFSEDMDLMPGQAEDPTPRSNADMDAAAASPRSSGSAGEGRVDASTGVPVTEPTKL
jgi:hypothetical protein